MSTTKKLTRRGNLTKYASWWGPVGHTDKENQVKMYKMYCFRYSTLSLRNGKDPDPYLNEKQDPDPYPDPYPYHKVLDLQYCGQGPKM